jgi:glycosyltransferase involved in cell wall biosynthesis
LNWRDITHPRAGGAEKVTHEIARRWIAWGHKVTLFCASYAGAQSEDTIDGVSVIRRGRQQTVHWEAYRHYRCLFRGRCDVIIDEVNTIPFFTPLYVSEPVIMYSNQLAREVWRYEAPFPLSTLGYMAESLYLRAYCRTPIMTISRSTENDLRALGLPGPYHIIPMSINTKAPMVLPPLETKETHLTLVFVGRVVPSKRVDHMVQALALIHQAGLRQAHLWIIGAWNDEYRCKLNNQIVNLGLGGHVTFWGRVDDVTKERLLGAAHIFVMTSVREGWGLVVTEANALGTPAIVYNVPGLRDSTRHGETGLVCRSNNPLALAHTIMSLRQDSELYMRLRHCAWATAKRLSWDQTARAAWDVVEACL